VGLDGVEFGQLSLFEAKPVHAKSNTDSVQVPGKRAIVAQLSDLPKALEESLLGDILSLMPISQQICRGADKAVSMSGDQKSKSRLVAHSATGNPLSFLGHRINRNGCV
jgi:hypothetical protein